MRFVTLLLLSAVLLGCTREVIVYRDRVSYIYPDANWVSPCNTAAPPTYEEFMRSTPHQREMLLATWGIQQSKHLRLCDEGRRAVREWIKRSQQPLKGEGQ